MSKTYRSFLFVFAAGLQILHFLNNSIGQDLEVRIRLDAATISRARVDGGFLNQTRLDRKNLVFLREFAGTASLADRVTVISLKDGNSQAVGFRKLMHGEYLAESDILGWSYDFSLSPIGGPSARAHVSWIDGEKGIFMLNDLLPQTSRGERVSGRVSIELPVNWNIITTEPEAGKGVFNVSDIEKAVFIISKEGTARVVSSTDSPLRFSIFGSWQFADSEALSMANGIAVGYDKIFGGRPDKKAQITLMRFPGNVSSGNWEADTRGNSITILSSDMPFKTQSIQRLHEQLRHEIFHLWIPNGVNLSGNYDWFYEGFALYESLKSGVAANQLRFDDLLGSLAQAYNIENTQVERLSLIEASGKRWNGSNTRVYARGMLVAFLCDLALLQRSKGRSSVETLLREVYQKYHSSPKRENGSDAVLDTMRSLPELKGVIDRFITGSERFDWQAELLTAGIESVTEDSLISLKIVSKPNGRQRDLLDKLGYNSWRKLSEKSK